jgi:lipopolysaccharide biosynthesis protein
LDRYWAGRSSAKDQFMRDFCLFAHFDKDDKVDDYALHYLKHIRDLNFSIVFVSTARLPRSGADR